MLISSSQQLATPAGDQTNHVTTQPTLPRSRKAKLSPRRPTNSFINSFIDMEERILKAMGDLQNCLSTDIAQLRDEIRGKTLMLEKEIHETKTKLNEHEDSINRHEREHRKRNIIIRGLIEDEKTISDLEGKVMKLLTADLKINIAISEIDQIHRLGRKLEGQNRPTLVKFLSFRNKIAVLQHKDRINGTSISISEDFPKAVIAERKRLTPLMIKCREENKHAIIKYDNLIVNHKKLTKEEVNTMEENTRKRQLSDKDENEITKIRKEDAKGLNLYLDKMTQSAPTGTSKTRGRPRSISNTSHNSSKSNSRSNSCTKQASSHTSSQPCNTKNTPNVSDTFSPSQPLLPYTNKGPPQK